MRRRERHSEAIPIDPIAGLRTAVEGLTGAIDAGGAYLPPQQVTEAERVLRKASERLALSGDHTVVALAGATGAGKSSLFNVLAGENVSRVGALRPTTSRIAAAVWGPGEVNPLLEWIGAQVRHHVRTEGPGGQGWSRNGDDATPDGLILLDLPDIDSLRTEHRAEADRALELVDVFVWVTDPQKYADAILHDVYLRQAARHQTVTLVVLNQSDRVGDAEAQECRDDLRRLLAEDGLPAAEVLLVSARTGDGLDELRDALAGATRAATAARARLLADVQREADVLIPHVGQSEPSIGEGVDAEVIDALSRAAGIPIVLDTVALGYRRQAYDKVGWPFRRWFGAMRRDPAKKIRLDGDGGGDVAALMGQTPLPQSAPSARAAVDLAARQVGVRASRGLPGRWARGVQDAAAPDGDRLAEELDQAILNTPIQDRAPLWWHVVGLLQILLALAFLGGVCWGGSLAAMGYLGMSDPDKPLMPELTLPTAMVIVGAVGNVLLTLGVRVFVRIGAARRRALMERRLLDQVDRVALEHLTTPVRDVLDRHRRTREHLAAARAA